MGLRGEEGRRERGEEGTRGGRARLRNKDLPEFSFCSFFLPHLVVQMRD